ncbi:HNH endonuclease [Methylocystis heyeri]|uniref:HNH endonuclease n=1 Tax=Methylocystis heyeri TaxID=391905 RepID=A0A6B8KCH6_9HYPH|nr:HNH endonuclease [Methylocystis heyeri]QGM46134.1 HNH endonuclease [Methylocystis heyeri]
MARDYAKEYRDYQGTPAQIKKRSERNHARLEAEKKLGKAAIKGKDIGHKKALDNGGSNSASNTKVQSVKSNRGWRAGRKGYSVPNV